MVVKVVTVAEMVAIEQAADAAGISYQQMMHTAGTNLATTVFGAYSHLESRSCLGLVGKGNNGGDTLVALRWLAERGWAVAAYLAVERPDDPLVAQLADQGARIESLHDDNDFECLAELLFSHSVALDGLLGTGIKLPLRSPIDRVLRFVKAQLAQMAAPVHIVAVDCPSGVDCDTGQADENCLAADMTVCMAAMKRGMLSFPAYGYLGKIKMVEIGLPEPFPPLEQIPISMIQAEDVYTALPPRPLDSHKGSYGTALIVAGSKNYLGASLLAGRAAFRSGTGLVTMGVIESLYATLAGHFPEATWIPLPEFEGGISADATDVLAGHLERPTAVLLGPGFGLHPDTRAFVEQFLQHELPPMVVDADGLKLLAQIEEWAAKLPPNTILTPHPGEMSILCGLPAAEIQADRISVAQSYAHRWGHIVVLKGANTIVAHPDGSAAIIPVATPALARAGTGDVLAGLIVGLLAQGMEPYQAAYSGVWLHAQAGLLAAQQVGSAAGVLAGDLIPQIPQLLNFSFD